jgi:hypothetical protein
LNHFAKTFARAFVIEIVKRLVTFGAQAVQFGAAVVALRSDRTKGDEYQEYDYWHEHGVYAQAVGRFSNSVTLI